MNTVEAILIGAILLLAAVYFLSKTLGYYEASIRTSMLYVKTEGVLSLLEHQRMMFGEINMFEYNEESGKPVVDGYLIDRAHIQNNVPEVDVK